MPSGRMAQLKLDTWLFETGIFKKERLFA